MLNPTWPSALGLGGLQRASGPLPVDHGQVVWAVHHTGVRKGSSEKSIEAIKLSESVILSPHARNLSPTSPRPAVTPPAPRTAAGWGTVTMIPGPATAPRGSEGRTALRLGSGRAGRWGRTRGISGGWRTRAGHTQDAQVWGCACGDMCERCDTNLSRGCGSLRIQTRAIYILGLGYIRARLY